MSQWVISTSSSTETRLSIVIEGGKVIGVMLHLNPNTLGDVKSFFDKSPGLATLRRGGALLIDWETRDGILSTKVLKLNEVGVMIPIPSDVISIGYAVKGSYGNRIHIHSNPTPSPQ